MGEHLTQHAGRAHAYYSLQSHMPAPSDQSACASEFRMFHEFALRTAGRCMSMAVMYHMQVSKIC